MNIIITTTQIITYKISKYLLNTNQIKPPTFHNTRTSSTPHIPQIEQLTESTLAQMRHQVMQQRVKVEEER